MPTPMKKLARYEPARASGDPVTSGRRRIHAIAASV